MPEIKDQEKSETKKPTRQIHVPKIVPPDFLAAAGSSESVKTVTEPEVQQPVNTKNLNKSEAVEYEVPVNQEPNAHLTNADKPASKFTNRKNVGKAEIPPPSNRLNEQKLARLLKRERLDLYSLQQVLRGSSMSLYCVLYNASKSNNGRCQITQNNLMFRAEINNPGTLQRQELWLQQLRLIEKNNQLGDHRGVEYRVYPLDSLPLPQDIIDQLDSYLIEYEN